MTLNFSLSPNLYNGLITNLTWNKYFFKLVYNKL